MNRRKLLVRTLTGTFTAGVYTATGWLMGTRTLTMGQLSGPMQVQCLGRCPVNCWDQCYQWPPTCIHCADGQPGCRHVWLYDLGCAFENCFCRCGTGYKYGSCPALCACDN